MNKEEQKKRRQEILDSIETKIEDKNFQCNICFGKGKVVWVHNLQINECYSCESSGSRVEQLLHDIKFIELRGKDLRKEVEYLTNFIKLTSSCKTCGGNRMKTFGLTTCEECGLEGNCPWPG